jgi:hypothetical protein
MPGLQFNPSHGVPLETLNARSINSQVLPVLEPPPITIFAPLWRTPLTSSSGRTGSVSLSVAPLTQSGSGGRLLSCFEDRAGGVMVARSVDAPDDVGGEPDGHCEAKSAAVSVGGGGGE